jgi:hypothetical protein
MSPECPMSREGARAAAAEEPSAAAERVDVDVVDLRSVG